MSAVLDNEEFEFPDTDDKKVADGEVEITFEEGGEVDAPKAKESTDEDDLDQYSSKVQKRIKKLTRGYSEAQRERDEAVRVAQIQRQEIEQLRKRAHHGENLAVNGYTEAARSELEKAKKAYKEAYEAGDSDALLAAAEAMSDAKIRIKEIEMVAAPLQQRETEVQIPQEQVRAPKPDQRAVEWANENSWFLKDEEMTQYVLGLDEKLKRQGYDPTSDEYYETIDARMRKVFPEHDWDDKPVQRQSKKPSNVVAPATRSTAPKKVTLTKTQVALANKLGVPLEVYARELVKQMESDNG